MKYVVNPSNYNLTISKLYALKHFKADFQATNASTFVKRWQIFKCQIFVLIHSGSARFTGDI